MKRKLMTLLVLIGIVPLCFLSVFAYWQISTTMQDEYQRAGISKVGSLQVEVNSLLQKNMYGLKTIANSGSAKSLDIVSGKEVLVNAAAVYTDISPIAIVNGQGLHIVRNDNNRLPDVSKRPYFKQVMQGSDDVVSDVLIGQTNGHPMVILATPVKNESGAVIGAIQGSLDLTTLSGFIAERSKDGDTAYIVDREGKILAHPDSAVVDERKDVTQLNYVQQVLGGQDGSMNITGSNGEKRMVSYARDPYTGWGICIEQSYDRYTAQVHKLAVTDIIILIVTICIVIAIGYFFAKKTIKPILSLVVATNEVKNGNLIVTVDKNSNDEMGLLAENFSAMVKSLRLLVQKVSVSSEEVTASSQQLTATSEQSAQAANDIAGAVTNIAEETMKQRDIVNEMNTLVQRIFEDINNAASNVRQAAEAAEQSTETATQGEKQIELAVNQMENIEKTVACSATAVAELGRHSHAIGEIVSTITSLANQTNLLALNAAIEAARAGEAGKGFAVVAEEVRKLAEQSGDAAKQVGEIISTIQVETSKAVKTMEAGSSEVQSGVSVVKTTGEAFHDIVTFVKKVSEQVTQSSQLLEGIAASSNKLMEANQKVEGVTKTTAAQSETISASTQQQSASVEEIAASSQKLARMAEELSVLVNHFSYK
ncbi:Methyl-accepting chemotaxis protein McpB [Sporomusa silvacetica DSM 10669]|uniref:Methyl-accepting chemotaxis protein McpB n=1 Tax=Sporomusa silvacetica DSM 10669 TaxID=1123289 RepID=A0ABZ3INK3_9FIRM|nr:methyl-accepting chemotaxis protein McpB [Sporomusa silvacetica DSM 10669]